MANFGQPRLIYNKLGETPSLKDFVIQVIGSSPVYSGLGTQVTVGDGSSHPLSTFYASLGAAQADYPHATALTDELAWAALQSAVNYIGSAGGGTVFIPRGKYILGTQTTWSKYDNVNLRGVGDNSILSYSGSGAALQFFMGTTVTVNASTSVWTAATTYKDTNGNFNYPVNGDQVKIWYDYGGAEPSGAVSTSIYTVMSASGATFKISSDGGVTPVTITDTGSGVLRICITTNTIYRPSVRHLQIVCSASGGTGAYIGQGLYPQWKGVRFYNTSSVSGQTGWGLVYDGNGSYGTVGDFFNCDFAQWKHGLLVYGKGGSQITRSKIRGTNWSVALAAGVPISGTVAILIQYAENTIVSGGNIENYETGIHVVAVWPFYCSGTRVSKPTFEDGGIDIIIDRGCVGTVVELNNQGGHSSCQINEPATVVISGTYDGFGRNIGNFIPLDQVFSIPAIVGGGDSWITISNWTTVPYAGFRRGAALNQGSTLAPNAIGIQAGYALVNTTLAVGINNSTTSLTVNANQRPLPTLPAIVLIESEYLLVTNYGAGNTAWTVMRGYLGSSAASHAINQLVDGYSGNLTSDCGAALVLYGQSLTGGDPDVRVPGSGIIYLGRDQYGAGNPSATFSVNNGLGFGVERSGNTLVHTSHGLSNGTPVQCYNRGGALPTGLSVGTTYYVVSAATNSFSLASTPGGSAITLSGYGSGANYVSDNSSGHGLSMFSVVEDGGTGHCNLSLGYLLFENYGAAQAAGGGGVVDDRAIYMDADSGSSATQRLILQAGKGNAAFGGAVCLYSHQHASKPGWVEVGISSGSGGRVGFNSSALGGGTSIFSVDASGVVYTQYSTGVLYNTSGTVGAQAGVGNGTYTVGNKITPVSGNNGTITITNGVITAIQQAT